MACQASSAMPAIAEAIAGGAGAHGHRVAHVQPAQGVDGGVGPEPRVEPHHQLAGRPGPPHPGDELLDEPFRPPLGVGRAFAQPGMEHFAAVGPGRQDRVVAELLGVAEPGALLGVTIDFADRRVDIDHQPCRAGAGTERPRSGDDLGGRRFELADMTERERSQERPQRRGGHHPMRQHRTAGAGPQHVGVIDVGCPGDHGVDQGEHLAARTGPADPADQPHHRVDHRFHPQPSRQRRRQQQPGIGDQVRVIEDGVDAVDPVRYSRHWKCLPAWSTRRLQNTVIVPGQEAFLVDTRAPHTSPIGGSRLSA